MTFAEIWNTVINWLATEGIKIVISIVLLIVTFAIINWLSKKVKKWSEKKGMDATIAKVLVYVVRIGLKCLVVVSLLGYLGIDTAAAASVITTIGLGIGLAVQGSLANFAGGVLIILLRPLRVGDYVEAQGIQGTVEDITIFYTYIVTIDNRVVCVPNGALANGNIINYTKKDLRRVDITFSINAGEDYTKAQKAILDVCAANDLILKEPATQCRVINLTETTIDLVARAWTSTANYWDVYFYMYENVKAKFIAEGIKGPAKALDIKVENK